MKWTDGHNGGFSAAKAEDLYLPVIDEGPYAYDRVNVAAQEADGDSQLNWTTRLIGVRRRLGFTMSTSWHLGESGNDAVLAIYHRDRDDFVLTLHNFSSGPQSVEPELFADMASLHFATFSADRSTDQAPASKTDVRAAEPNIHSLGCRRELRSCNRLRTAGDTVPIRASPRRQRSRTGRIPATSTKSIPLRSKTTVSSCSRKGYSESSRIDAVAISNSPATVTLSSSPWQDTDTEKRGGPGRWLPIFESSKLVLHSHRRSHRGLGRLKCCVDHFRRHRKPSRMRIFLRPASAGFRGGRGPSTAAPDLRAVGAQAQEPCERPNGPDQRALRSSGLGLAALSRNDADAAVFFDIGLIHPFAALDSLQTHVALEFFLGDRLRFMLLRSRASVSPGDRRWFHEPTDGREPVGERLSAHAQKVITPNRIIRSGIER